VPWPKGVRGAATPPWRPTQAMARGGSARFVGPLFPRGDFEITDEPLPSEEPPTSQQPDSARSNGQPSPADELPEAAKHAMSRERERGGRALPAGRRLVAGLLLGLLAALALGRSLPALQITDPHPDPRDPASGQGLADDVGAGRHAPTPTARAARPRPARRHSPERRRPHADAPHRRRQPAEPTPSPAPAPAAPAARAAPVARHRQPAAPRERPRAGEFDFEVGYR
jgi:hypothetical protein